MEKAKRVAIVALVVGAAAAAVVLKQSKESAPESAIGNEAAAPVRETAAADASHAAQSEHLPRLVDLGADKCVPCKMMAPILQQLKKEYAGVFKTEVIDVWHDPEPGRRYGIRVIPTQIFFDAEGKELFRHEGYFGKEEILAKWKEYGVNVQATEKE